MKKVNLDNLPKSSQGIRWKECVGKSIDFIFDNLSGTIDIIDYECINKNPKIKLQYKDIIKWSSVTTIKEGRLASFLNIYRTDYSFNIGDIAYEQFEILEQKYLKRSKNSNQLLKAYKCRCIKCGYEFDITETALCTYHDCPSCCKCPKKLIKGYNDLMTRYPEISKLMLEPNDAINHLHHSNDKVDWMCPICGNIIKSKSIYYVIDRGLKCPRCTDNHIKYPERVMFELLTLLGVEFSMHVKFDWSNNKEYDFYIKNKSCIIETHGNQHYEEKHGNWTKIKSLLEEQENDKFKENLAKENGIVSYIVIDCRKSDFEWIYNNILESELHTIFNFDEINKKELESKTYKNYVKFIADLWNDSNCTFEQIRKYINISDYLIRTYLKQATRIGLCNYYNKAMMEYKYCNKLINTTCKQVRCVNEDIKFKSLTEASKYYNISVQIISKSCKSNKPTYKSGLLFEFTN